MSDTSLSTSMGVTGWMTSGGVSYDYRSDTDGSLAIYYEGKTLDSCMGHSTGFYEYHYHANPVCITNADVSSTCTKIGYFYDGYPVFGYCENSDGDQLKSCWTATDSDADNDNIDDYYYDSAAYAAGTCHLGECNDYTFSDGTFGYVMTEDVPYVPKCSWGAKTFSPCGFTPEE
jgi:hypothetical protein